VLAGGYPQPLAPPPHMHGYKMGAHPGMAGVPANQQIPYSPQAQQAQQYSQGNYNTPPRPMGQYGPGPNQYGPQPGLQPGLQPGSQPTNNMAPGPGQYPAAARGIPNHVPHSQFGGYQVTSRFDSPVWDALNLFGYEGSHGCLAVFRDRLFNNHTLTRR